jgi:acyl-CoA thioester hydrolase
MSLVYVGSLTVPAWAIDANHHVNNVAYLHWMQHTSLAHSSVGGWNYERYLKRGWAWVVRSHTIDYLAPCYAGERISVISWVSRVGVSSAERRYIFWRNADAITVAEAKTAFVFIEAANGNSRPIPDEIRGLFPPDNSAVDLLENLMRGESRTAARQLHAALLDGHKVPGLYLDPLPIEAVLPSLQFQAV